MSVLLATVLAMQSAQTLDAAASNSGPEIYLCTLVNERRQIEEYVLTLLAGRGYLVGQKPNQTFQMKAPTAITTLTGFTRAQGKIRRMELNEGDNTVYVRQLFQSDALISTVMTVGSSKRANLDLTQESLNGFCLPNLAKSTEKTQ
jgi:plasmid replication initiation protein